MQTLDPIPANSHGPRRSSCIALFDLCKIWLVFTSELKGNKFESVRGADTAGEGARYILFVSVNSQITNCNQYIFSCPFLDTTFCDAHSVCGGANKIKEEAKTKGMLARQILRYSPPILKHHLNAIVSELEIL